MWVHGDVRRPRGLEAHWAPPPLHQPPNRGKHGGLDRLVKSQAVVRRVVEPIFLAMGVVTEVVEVRISGHLLAQVVHAIEDACELVAQLAVRLRPMPESLFPQSSVS